jgi:hypothetical protein
MKNLIMSFAKTTYYFIPIRFKYSPQHPVLKHPHSMFSLNIRDQVSHSYNTTGEIIEKHIEQEEKVKDTVCVQNTLSISLAVF